MTTPDLLALERELAVLASALCLDAGIHLEVRGERWSYDPIRRTLSVSEPSLRDNGRDWCAGRLVNEIGHYWLTRHDLFSVDFPSVPIAQAILDALEDGRVNGWMAARYPGSRDWLAEVHRGADAPVAQPLPLVLWFCLECALEPGRGWAPAPHPVPDPVRRALDQTRAARQAYSRIRPATEIGQVTDPDLRLHWAERVRPQLLWGMWPPAAYEAEVQLRALDALELAEDEILPAAEALLGEDRERIEQWLSAQPMECQRLQERIEAGEAQAAFEAACAHAGAPCPCSGEAREMAMRLLEAMQGQQRGAEAGAAGQFRRVVHSNPFEGFGEAGRPAFAPPPPRRLTLQPAIRTDYNEARLAVANQIEQLVRLLERILRPRQRLRMKSGYPSGRRVDLRRLMAFEADPRRYNELWSRSSIPERRRVVFSLLIDLSGSMRGDKCKAALLGTVLMAETLARLQVPFAINGFQDVLIPFSPFHARFGPAVRDEIATMPHEVAETRVGGNNNASNNDDGPCVLEAANELLQESADRRVLLVVSDGQPAGRRSTAEDLHNTVRALTSPGVPLELLGIGLGPGTEHVTGFYPQSVASVPLDDFAQQIGNLIMRGLRVSA